VRRIVEALSFLAIIFVLYVFAVGLGDVARSCR
jgi:hypothetical protein